MRYCELKVQTRGVGDKRYSTPEPFDVPEGSTRDDVR
jgi:hypothetical protein